jgi:hypothetical protein
MEWRIGWIHPDMGIQLLGLVRQVVFTQEPSNIGFF